MSILDFSGRILSVGIFSSKLMIRFISPAKDLSDFVKEYWVWEGIRSSELPWILPSYEPELVFHFSEPPVLLFPDSSRYNLDRIHWIGPQTRRWKVESKTPLELASIRFHPGALWELYSISSAEISDRFPPLSEVLEFRSDKNFRIYRKGSDLSAHLDSFLRSNIGKKREIPVFLKSALEALKKAARVDELASELGISRKQLDRKFKKIYGLSPKDFRKLHRVLTLVRNPMHYKNINEHVRLTDIALESGYSDQPHLIKEFKEISGISPKEWFDFYKKMSHFYNSDSEKSVIKGIREGKI